MEETTNGSELPLARSVRAVSRAVSKPRRISAVINSLLRRGDKMHFYPILGRARVHLDARFNRNVRARVIKSNSSRRLARVYRKRAGLEIG